jgi:hypothetical protein
MAEIKFADLMEYAAQQQRKSDKLHKLVDNLRLLASEADERRWKSDYGQGLGHGNADAYALAANWLEELL